MTARSKRGSSMCSTQHTNYLTTTSVKALFQVGRRVTNLHYLAYVLDIKTLHSMENHIWSGTSACNIARTYCQVNQTAWPIQALHDQASNSRIESCVSGNLDTTSAQKCERLFRLICGNTFKVDPPNLLSQFIG